MAYWINGEKNLMSCWIVFVQRIFLAAYPSLQRERWWYKELNRVQSSGLDGIGGIFTKNGVRTLKQRLNILWQYSWEKECISYESSMQNCQHFPKLFLVAKIIAVTTVTIFIHSVVAYIFISNNVVLTVLGYC